MSKVVAFGEMMLRLKSPGKERLFQSPMFEATFGGGEANVAISLANYGMNTAFVSALPDNMIGDACIAELRKQNVDASMIKRMSGRMGAYYLEAGANQRPAKVIYDREYSCVSLASPTAYDWSKILNDALWFHISGITPAISENAAKVTLEAVMCAKQMNITVSCDLNYRANLWKYGKKASEVMPEIFKYVDIGIAGAEDCQKALGIQTDADMSVGKLQIDEYHKLIARVFERYPNLQLLAVTLRESISADYNSWAACLGDRKNFYVSNRYEIRDIVDRIGGGDAFSAGLIYGLIYYDGKQDALDFATAAGCLKHSIPGDYNRVSVAEVESIKSGNASGRVNR